MSYHCYHYIPAWYILKIVIFFEKQGVTNGFHCKYNKINI